jgi:mannitol-specific phosphotransferase system IIBC component
MMLVNNFSAAILPRLMAVAGYVQSWPRSLRTVTDWLGSAVETLVDNGLLPLTVDLHRAGEGACSSTTPSTTAS